MKIKLNILTFLILFIASIGANQAQDSAQDKMYSLAFGFGYYTPILTDEGVSYPDAQFVPDIGVGFSYSASFDYSLSEDLYIGLGLNGNLGSAGFIKDATINDAFVDGYLEAGALENMRILINCTYAPAKDGIQPYGKLGLGYFIDQVELGDVPLSLTNNVEFELFPDYKYAGIGVIPELGAKYNDFSLSVAYGLPFGKLTGETIPESYVSTGTIISHGIQINAAYRIFLF